MTHFDGVSSLPFINILLSMFVHDGGLRLFSLRSLLANKSGFPSVSDLNARLRRLIASYQRENRKEATRKAQRDKRQLDKRERFEQAVRDREQKKRDVEQRWSRREEIDFYRVRVEFITRTRPHRHVFGAGLAHLTRFFF